MKKTIFKKHTFWTDDLSGIHPDTILTDTTAMLEDLSGPLYLQ